ncbi:MAG TPA: hypothetical protein VN924_01510 [Bryobacteraceae bacterium]|nr:hypothetical protein [Bryobacteraceae bacterium]
MAAVPLEPTLGAPVRFVAEILTADPAPAAAGRIFTNGASPTGSLKTVP